MQKYHWKQEFKIMDEKGSTIKECNIQIYLNETGIKQELLSKMFCAVEAHFLKLFQEEDIPYGNSKITWSGQQDVPKTLFEKY